MIQSFRDQGTEDVFNGVGSRKARSCCTQQIWTIASKRLEYLDAAMQLEDLRVPPGNRLEALVGDRKGQHSIRINQQYRVCFIWTEAGPTEVEIVDYH